MSEILKPHQPVQTEISKSACEITSYLGGGGQGEVYAANLGGKQVAVKWYYPESATDSQRKILEELIKKGAPNERFLWPFELVSARGVNGFGYIMPLRDSSYKGIVDMMKRRVEPNFRALTTAAIQLSDGYYQLHAEGLCYRDISFGNVFFDPNSGDVLICDNDNVTIDREDAEVGVLGTFRFMAPEIVRGEAKPRTSTDLFSLSVLLFYMFMLHHPLEGKKEASIKCLDLAAMRHLYGDEPVFIWDPNDDSNRPVPGVHDNAIAYWPIYPKFLRDLFTKAFTDGILDPLNGRVRETVWRSKMVKLRDSIIYCSSVSCGAENFYDADALKAGKTPRCWACNSEIRLPFRMRIGDSIVMLNRDTQLYPHHIDDGKKYDFSHPVAKVVQHPKDPNIWGLQNLSDKKWSITKPNGDLLEVEVGQRISLATGLRIYFGTTQGEIRY
jgi:eukaryotic-like serine/threonine-protein kinase